MITFATYWPLLLLAAPFLVTRLVKPAKVVQSDALYTPFFLRFTHLANAKTLRFQHQKPPLILHLIWILLIVAAMGPQWLGEAREVNQHGRNIMMAVDISASMQTPDMTLNRQPIDRLAMVKQVAKQFIQERRGDRIGLILFGTRAYLQTPLTFDLLTVQTLLNDATIGLAGPQTAGGDALGLAIKRLKALPSHNKVIILLTDGATNAGVDPLETAKIAKANGIKIYTIGVGAEKMLVPGLLGPQMINPAADLDEKTLSEIAKLTDGLYFRATDGAALKKIYAEINHLEPTASKNLLIRPKTDMYYIPLLLAFLLTLGLALRRSFRKIELCRSLKEASQT